MKLLKRILLIVLFSLSSLCLFAYKSLDIAFTHDFHSHIDPYKTVNDKGEVQLCGGSGNLKSLVDDIRKSNPNLLLLDGGDFSMGTLYQTIFETAACELTLFSAIGYDCTTFGNHEFDLGEDAFVNMYETYLKNTDESKRISFIKSANASYENSPLKKLDLVDYQIIERGGTKIAVFAIMGKEAQRYTRFSNVRYLPIVQSAKNIIKTIKDKENPDIIICLSHSGTSENKKQSEDEQLALSCPEIDLIISAHSHTVLEQPIVVNNTMIVSSGCYGSHLGYIRIEKDDGKKWRCLTYKLFSISPSYKEDEEVKKLVNRYKRAINSDYLSEYHLSADDVVMYSPVNFENIDTVLDYRTRETALSNLLSDSLLYMYNNNTPSSEKAVVGVIPTGLIRDTIYKGNITVSDLFLINSLGGGQDGKTGYPLCDFYISGKEIIRAAEVAVSLSPFMSSANLQFSGLRFKANKARMILNRVYDAEVLENGVWQKIDKNKMYKCVTDLYTLEMIGAVSDVSKGLIKFLPRSENGEIITDYKERIVHFKNGTEMKGWLAPLSFASSLSKGQGNIPVLTQRHYTPDSRRDIHTSLRPSELFTSLNIYSVVLIAAILVVLILAVILVFMIKRIVIKHRQKKILRNTNPLIEDKRGKNDRH